MSDRLSRNTWVEHGLAVLAREGPESLNAVRSAKSLGVSRGSFYWHFKDLEDYHSAILARWRDDTTQAAILHLEPLLPGAERLEALIRLVISTSNPTEAAIRRWAGSSALVMAAVAAVDELRLGYVRAELTAAGVAADAVEARAAAMVWACAGRALTYQAMPLGEPGWPSELTALFTSDKALQKPT